MKYRLSEKSRQILDHLSTVKRPLSASSIARSLGLKDDTVRSLIESLRQKKLIEDKETIRIEFYQLTPEGQHFATKGLPEIRLVKLLAKQGGAGSVESIADTKVLKPLEQTLALGWARRNKWISVSESDGQTWMKLTSNTTEAIKQHPLQLVLDSAKESGFFQLADIKLEKKYLRRIQNTLRKRKLAELVTRQTITVSITSKGHQALKAALTDKELIRDLSPDLLKSDAWKDQDFMPYNLRTPTSPLYPGKKHPFVEFIDRLKRVLIGLGFQEAKGPLVETEFWNNDALFMPQDHVAREVHDLYHIKKPKGPGRIIDESALKRVAKTHENGWKTGSTGWRYPYSFDIARRLVMRSQTTSVSMRFLSEHKEPPITMFSIDRNFRPEKFDATHSAEFIQIEGIIGGKDLTLRDLMGYIKAIAKGVGVEKIKFKPGFFPFTEPSVESFIFIPELGWKEFGGSGIFRPEVTLPFGIDFPVLAWGLGADRLAMAALGIGDIRELATRNLGQLRKASMRF